jgi:hypothetical protein
MRSSGLPWRRLAEDHRILLFLVHGATILLHRFRVVPASSFAVCQFSTTGSAECGRAGRSTPISLRYSPAPKPESVLDISGFAQSESLIRFLSE